MRSSPSRAVHLDPTRDVPGTRREQRHHARKLRQRGAGAEGGDQWRMLEVSSRKARASKRPATGTSPATALGSCARSCQEPNARLQGDARRSGGRIPRARRTPHPRRTSPSCDRGTPGATSRMGVPATTLPFALSRGTITQWNGGPSGSGMLGARPRPRLAAAGTRSTVTRPPRHRHEMRYTPSRKCSGFAAERESMRPAALSGAAAGELDIPIPVAVARTSEGDPRQLEPGAACRASSVG